MENKVALITGATSGIGAEYAKRFASKGYNLIITGRRREKIETIAEEIREKYRVAVEVVIVELSNIDEIIKLADKLKEKKIDAIVNNAGFGLKGYFINEDINKLGDMVEVHTLAPMYLTHAILPGMIDRNSGVIINVSSDSAFLLVPGNTVYAASKVFLKNFTESLYLELIGTNIKVQALCPGLTKTDFHEKIGMDKSKQVDRGFIKWMTTSEVVDISLKDLEKGKVVSTPGFDFKFRIMSMLPRRLYYKMMSMAGKKFSKSKD